ncbi:MAG TPA: CARDB domain-containing protein [Pyrinomonadaceae bacterium]|nr:CARDB domain-containing protein [Pyrinomonadaceae bacterium]
MTRITNIALVLIIAVFMAASTLAQTTSPEKAATADLPVQLRFVEREPYDANGVKGMRFKLSVKNRASLPDSLWHPSANLPPCGKSENASRTWVEIFGSPGDERLAGFCRLNSSEDLGRLWYVIPSGEKGPPCVYLIMTDRQTGQKYQSNETCSRLLSLVSGTRKAGGQTQKDKGDSHKGWIELTSSTQVNESPASTKGGFGWDSISTLGGGNATQQPGSGAATDKKAALAQPDLSISQFLFPPTNNKALRVRVVNTGKAPSEACRLIITVRKINGVAAGRTTHVNVPALAAGEESWLHIDAKSILPNNVSLQSTTFRLNVDATEIVGESNESNNEVWHNQ